MRRKLIEYESVSSGETEAWMRHAMHQFPTSQIEDRVKQAEDQAYNASTLQLSIFIANMGNLSRPSVIEGKK